MQPLILKIKNLLTSRFLKDVGSLSVGSFVKIGVAFFVSILVTRLLGAHDYGIYSIAMSFSSILLMFSRFSFQASFVTLLSEEVGKKNPIGVRQSIVWFFKNQALVSFLILLLCALAPLLTAHFYPDIPRMDEYVQIYLLSVFFSSIYFFVTTILQVLRKTTLLSILEVAKDTSWRVIAVGLLLLGLKIFGVVLAQLIAVLILLGITTVLYIKICKDEHGLFPTFRDIAADWKSVSFFRHFKFTFAISIDNNLNALYTSMPVFLIGIWSDPVQAGYVGLALNLINVPKTLAGNISKMLSSILPHKKYSAEAGTDGWADDARRATRYSLPALAAVMAAFAVGCAIFIPIIYGEEFRGAIFPTVVVAILNMGIGATLAIGPLVRTMRKMNTTIVANLIGAATSALAMYFLIPRYGALGAVLGMLAWKIAHWVLAGYLFRLLKNER